MIVEHEDFAGHLEAANRHLSYGEKNAFALVLFMHHVRKVQPDLVVLDDPVSSFDKTKKFAILHQLLHGSSSIREYTTLLLTHDIEPAIDIVLNPTSGQFAMMQPIAHFLRGSAGTVQEKQIERRHISTFSQVCKDNIDASSDDVIKSIYLRRLYEVHGDLGVEYDILSKPTSVAAPAAGIPWADVVNWYPEVRIEFSVRLPSHRSWNRRGRDRLMMISREYDQRQAALWDRLASSNLPAVPQVKDAGCG
jgi:hypothetical protein